MTARTAPDVPLLQRLLEDEIAQSRILHDENTELREALADRDERIERLQAEASSCQQQITAYRLREERRKAFIRNKDLIPMEKLVALAALEEVESKRVDIKEPTQMVVERIAAAVGATPGTVGKKFANLDKTGVLNYSIGQTEYNKDGSYYTPVTVAFTDLVETPGLIRKAPEDKQGGPRQKRCAHCGSEDLDRYTVLYCRECQRAGWYGQIGLRSDANVSDAMKAHPFHIVQDAFKENGPTPVHSENTLPCKGTDSIARQDEIAERLQEPEEVEDTRVSIQFELQEPPEVLRALRQWVCWRYEPAEKEGDKPKKVPYQTKGRSPQMAKSNMPATWAEYAIAKSTYEQSRQWAKPFDGIGFMFNHDYTGVDFDHCIEDGFTDELTAARVLGLNTYAEVSPSGTGVHCIARGTIPSGCKRPDIEMYDSGRFFTFTGQHIIGTPPTVEDRQELLTALHQEIAPAPLPKRESQATIHPCDYTSLPDAQVVEKARNAANGAKFRALFDEGNMSDYPGQDGRPDHSRADQALCRLLAYWTNGDAEQIDTLFRQSKLMRSKWDRNARAGETYGTGTIRRAIACYQEVSA